MDGNGDVALGYSVSSSTMHPAIRYTAHATSDPLGVMGQGEGSIIEGTGSQTKYLNIQPLSRWGDYSSLSVDPSDDCTFWYTSEYLVSNGAFNWHTRVGTFKVAGCGGVASPDFTVAASPGSRTVTAGGSTTYSATATATNGYSGTVAWTVSGLPSGATGSFSPTSTAPGSSSTLTVATSPSTPAGSYTLTISATDGPLTHSAQVTLVVQSQPTADFTIGATPPSQTVARGGTTSYTVTITPVGGFSGSVSLSVSGIPAHGSASFSPNPATSTSTLTVTTWKKTNQRTYTLTITGTSGGLTHTTTVQLAVQ
jgi:hypothetical protein